MMPDLEILSFILRLLGVEDHGNQNRTSALMVISAGLVAVAIPVFIAMWIILRWWSVLPVALFIMWKLIFRGKKRVRYQIKRYRITSFSPEAPPTMKPNKVFAFVQRWLVSPIQRFFVWILIKPFRALWGRTQLWGQILPLMFSALSKARKSK